MAAQSVLIIRHAEKAEPGGDNAVDLTGAPDPESLTPRGWQRAGAWATTFVPPLGQISALPQPDAIFASAPNSHGGIAAGAGGSKSRRPLETIAPLAARLQIEVDLRFGKGGETELAAAVSMIEGVALICWQHEDIVAIAKAVAPTASGIPDAWPGDRFNVIFRLDRADGVSSWVFTQVVPVMLETDKNTQI